MAQAPNEDDDITLLNLAIIFFEAFDDSNSIIIDISSSTRIFFNPHLVVVCLLTTLSWGKKAHVYTYEKVETEREVLLSLIDMMYNSLLDYTQHTLIMLCFVE